MDEFGPHAADLNGRPSPEANAFPAEPVAKQDPSIHNPLANLMAAAERLRADALHLSDAVEQIVQSNSRVSAIVDESVSGDHAEKEE